MALFLLLIIFGLLPSPLLEGLKAHMSRDSVREGLFVQICLNTAKNAAQADGCLAALIPDK